MSKFSLNIRTSLGLLFGTMLVVSVLQGTVAYLKIGTISSQTAELIDNTALSREPKNHPTDAKRGSTRTIGCLRRRVEPTGPDRHHPCGAIPPQPEPRESGRLGSRGLAF